MIELNTSVSSVLDENINKLKVLRLNLNFGLIYATGFFQMSFVNSFGYT